jgi:AraC family transcriptional regulator, regulatory protein of adaptative response / DNA-3-methyladenine glycosylase II
MNDAAEQSSFELWHRLGTAMQGNVASLRAAQLARGLGVETSELDRVMLEHRHKPFAHEVAELRVRAALDGLIENHSSVAQTAAAQGFASCSALNRALLGYCGLDASNLKALVGCAQFVLTLPPRYRVAETLAYLARDPRSHNVKRRSPDSVTLALVMRDVAFSATVTFGERSVAVELDTILDNTTAGPCVSIFRRLLGFAAPTDALLRRARTEPEVQRLIRHRRGLTVHQTATAWDALVWAVVGQQISLIAAYALLRALSQAAGLPVGSALRTLPRADAVAHMSASELRACKLSKAKTKTLHLLANRILAGELDFDALEHGSAVTAYEVLISQHGVGPWTANYVMMRGFGFADCAPIGDAGLRRALRHFLRLNGPPSDKDMARLMAPFAPHRSLATFHLWRGFDDALPAN